MFQIHFLTLKEEYSVLEIVFSFLNSHLSIRDLGLPSMDNHRFLHIDSNNNCCMSSADVGVKT